MIARRTLLGGALALLTMPPARAAGLLSAHDLPVPASGRLGFDVWLGTRKLGTHDLVFHPSATGLVVDIAVDLAFHVGPLTLYRYSHTAREEWSDGKVAALSTRTNDNGTRFLVNAHRQGNALMIEAKGKPPLLAPADALPATHWNSAELAHPWINTQNGEVIHPHVAPQGDIMVHAADDRLFKVRRYALTGPIDLTLWYDEAQAWAGLSFTKSGAQVRYARRA